MLTIRSGGGLRARLQAPDWRAGDWLGLAATPTFAVLALVTELSGGAAMCFASATSPLNEMTVMYGLMALFHLPSWLKLRIDRV